MKFSLKFDFYNGISKKFSDKYSQSLIYKFFKESDILSLELINFKDNFVILVPLRSIVCNF